MSSGSKPSTVPVESKTQLVEYLAEGCKPRDKWRIGTEHEKFGYRLDDLTRLPYEGTSSIKAMLEGLQRFGWQPIAEKGNVIALSMDGASISLEPGGQFELSGAPLENLHQTCDEVHTHLAQVREVAGEIGAGFLGLGFDPKWRREDVPIMPKGRYGIMLDYMLKKGKLGRDMMLRSCTVQVNLDYASEADMVEKFRISLALQSVATALFANSPFTEGKPNGFQSFRSHIWTDTDPDRCGVLPFVFEDGMGFERYAEHALDVPMYFVYRDGTYINAAGQSFRDFMDGKLPALPGERPVLSDWVDHLTTLFPEVRLKHYLEMRGADGGPWGRLCALPALWVGLLYDDAAQKAAAALAGKLSIEDIENLRRDVPRQGLKTAIAGGTVADLARDMVAIALDGLKNRARAGNVSSDETEYLAPLLETLENGETPADELLRRYEQDWGGCVDPVYREYAY